MFVSTPRTANGMRLLARVGELTSAMDAEDLTARSAFWVDWLRALRAGAAA
ncbi:MAG: hypothetical protein ACKV19_16290 [Verrucomicrobiales bacterium]